MSVTVILAIIILVLIVIIVVLMMSGDRSDNAESDLPPPAEQDLNTTFTPKTVISQTAPLEKGRKRKKDAMPLASNEQDVAQAGKDETFLPQTTATPSDRQDPDDNALTGAQKKK